MFYPANQILPRAWEVVHQLDAAHLEVNSSIFWHSVQIRTLIHSCRAMQASGVVGDLTLARIRLRKLIAEAKEGLTAELAASLL